MSEDKEIPKDVRGTFKNGIWIEHKGVTCLEIEYMLIILCVEGFLIAALETNSVP